MSSTEVSSDTKLALISQDISYIKGAMGDMNKKMDGFSGQVATKEEVISSVKFLEGEIQRVDTKYQLARTLIFGFCGLALVGVIGAVLSLIFRQ